MQLDLDQICSTEIAEYLFDRVWNEPTSEFRTNVMPGLLRNESIQGSIPLLAGNLKLPDKDSYYVWYLNVGDLNVGSNLTTGKWYNLVDLANNYNTLLNVTDAKGNMLHKGSMYVFLSLSRETMFLVAKKHMFKACTKHNKDLKDIFISVYYDSDHSSESRFSLCSISPDQELDELEFTRKVEQALEQVSKEQWLQVYVNGDAVTRNKIYESRENYIDILVDRNIEFTFTIDLPKNNDDPAYYSESQKRYKELIHIPRALNPDNWIITGNTCDFIVHHREKGHGRYLQRANVNVTQVTHNDMALDLYVLDAFRDHLGTEAIILEVVVRKHNKDNVLIRDANYIDLLYSAIHTDADIVGILLGKQKAGKVDFWSANYLEQARFVKMMFDTPNLVTRANMPEYVEALGFYHVAQLLSSRVMDLTVTDSLTNTFSIRLPALYRTREVDGILYLNSKYLSHRLYKLESIDGVLSITINPTVLIKPNDKISIVLYLTGNKYMYHFNIKSNNLKVHVPFTNCAVYVERKVTAFETVQGVNDRVSRVFQKLELNNNQYIQIPKDGGSDLVFSGDYINKDVYICDLDTCHKQVHKLNRYTKDGKPVAIPVFTRIYGEGDTTAPMLNIDNITVFVNRKYMVRDVDYKLNKVVDSRGYLAFYEVVLQSMDAFEPGLETDILEFTTFNEKTIDVSTGFIVDNLAQDVTPINLAFGNIGLTHVAGKLDRTGVFKGTYLEFAKGKHKTGSIFEIRSDIHQLVIDYLSLNSKNKENERLKVLNEYFSPKNFTPPDKVVIESKNRVYSTFLAKFIYDLVHKKVLVPDDPDESRMEAYIKDYLNLKEADVCYTQENNTYLEYYPQYVNYDVDVTTRRIIDKYVDKYLPINKDPSLEAVSYKQEK